MSRVNVVASSTTPYERIPLTTRCITALLLCLLTVLAYGNIFSSEFISYDDPLYILNRPQVWSGLSIDSIRWALTSTSDSNWIPLTWLSYLLDVSIFGVNACGHHAVNLLIHLVNTLLLLIVLSRMTGYFWRSVVVAALFALHPLHVESVAWIAERKDVLSGLFFMLTLLAYHHYSLRRSGLRYLVVVILFAVGLCAKSMLITLPCVLLLLDIWPLGRLLLPTASTAQPLPVGGRPLVSLTQLVVEKIPLLIFAITSAIITLKVQQSGGAVVEYSDSSLTENVANALVSYVMYIYKALFPYGLAVIYPFDYDMPVWQPILAALFMGVVSWFVIRFRHEYPYLPTCWFWFVCMLLPVIGIVAVGTHAMADRYSYLPHIGLFTIAVWGAADAAAVNRIGAIMQTGLALFVLGIVTAVTWVQVGYWQNEVTLFKHAIAVTEDNYVAYEHLGSHFQVRGDLNQAVIYIQESIRINPRNASAHTAMGIIYQNLRNNGEAIRSFGTALAIDPLYAPAHYELGKNLFYNGDTGGALREYDILVKIDPERAEHLKNLSLRQGVSRNQGYSVPINGTPFVD